MDHDDGTAHPATDRQHLLRGPRSSPAREDQRLGVVLQAPADGVLDLLRRVRLDEHLGHEELDEPAVVAKPVVPVVLRPPRIRLANVFEVLELPRRRIHDGHPGADDERTQGPLGMSCGLHDRGASAAGEPDEHRLLGLRPVHDRDRVGDELLAVVRLGVRRALRPAAPPPVERQHAKVPREERDLHFPLPRVDDRPRRQQEDRRLARAMHLVVEAHALALDVSGLVRVAGPRLLVRRCYVECHSALTILQPSSVRTRWTYSRYTSESTTALAMFPWASTTATSMRRPGPGSSAFPSPAAVHATICSFVTLRTSGPRFARAG